MQRHPKQWGKTPKLKYVSSEHNNSIGIKSGDRDALAFFSPICDALIVVVGLMQLIEALFEYASYKVRMRDEYSGIDHLLNK
jgi:hypothetical protein